MTQCSKQTQSVRKIQQHSQDKEEDKRKNHKNEKKNNSFVNENCLLKNENKHNSFRSSAGEFPTLLCLLIHLILVEM